jgi:hypothetical protein
MIKDHGRADARALTGAEINEREQLAREAGLAANIARKDTSATPPGTPPQAGESPYQTSITIANEAFAPTAAAPGANKTPHTFPQRWQPRSSCRATGVDSTTAPRTAGRAGPWQKAQGHKETASLR